MVGSVAIIGTRGYPSYYGGFETAVRKLAPYLADRGWDVAVYGRPGIKSDDPSRDSRVRVIETPGIENKSLSTLSFGLSSCLHAMWTRPDVALIMNVANGFWLPLLALRGIPTVVNVDGIEWERAKWGRLAKTIFRLGARMTARFGTVLVADSTEIQRRWMSEFSRESVYIPYGGEALADPDPVEGPLHHRRYVLAVARFVPENTIPEFLEAARRLAADYEVVIVGSAGYGGTLDEAARSLAAEFSSVRWLGHVSDDKRLLSLWQHCGAYFHGHSVGGTNPALVQAMANGAPIIARDTVYNREVLANAGEFCNPNPQDIERAIRRVMDSEVLQNDLSAAAKARLHDGYTWESVCSRYEAAIREQIQPAIQSRRLVS
ncbi:glycosyltransferase [Arthrobacter sp. B2a2-09]|uniref:glycosyltransferase n=1 Tax=Arthrobacter sp. B2a2-09 TaxID=2952822 RepID=UPI0022CD34E4|nr:glycosyltransferase [Arthrobacter sp. B2a2-09]MCZ9882307.1 glycosyltransferase [Arthrobacter sp. B2a2-09]